MRKKVRHILARHGFDNAFTIRKRDFSDLARSVVRVITIKDWQPNPLAWTIEDEILTIARASGEKAVVDFEVG